LRGKSRDCAHPPHQGLFPVARSQPGYGSTSLAKINRTARFFQREDGLPALALVEVALEAHLGEPITAIGSLDCLGR